MADNANIYVVCHDTTILCTMTSFYQLQHLLLLTSRFCYRHRTCRCLSSGFRCYYCRSFCYCCYYPVFYCGNLVIIGFPRNGLFFRHTDCCQRSRLTYFQCQFRFIKLQTLLFWGRFLYCHRTCRCLSSSCRCYRYRSCFYCCYHVRIQLRRLYRLC